VGGTQPVHFHVSKGEVVASSHQGPAAYDDRLYLAAVSGLPEFRAVYEALSGMAFYKLSPDRIRDVQPPDAGDLLARDGSNIASVIGRLEARAPDRKKRIEEYLQNVVPGLKGIEAIHFGAKETLQFQQDVEGQEHPWRFLAANMSDGTLRALGVLTSLFQEAVPLIGIEEPEFALHPAAASVLRDALHEAAESRQVVVTSHSPDLLDHQNIRLESVCAVTVDQGATQIAPLDDATRESLMTRAYTAGQLLRLDQLRPDTRLFAERTRQLRLL
jgi:predicted ATPase